MEEILDESGSHPFEWKNKLRFLVGDSLPRNVSRKNIPSELIEDVVTIKSISGLAKLLGKRRNSLYTPSKGAIKGICLLYGIRERKLVAEFEYGYCADFISRYRNLHLREPEEYSLAEAMRRVIEAPTDNFVELVRLAGLDPTRHMRFCDWSGVDFSGSDLRGFDFSGARLRNCQFEGARISGARFDKADISGSSIREAADWADFARSWEISSDPVSDGHLRPGAVFQDAPFAPEMVVIPPGRFLMGSKEGEGESSEWPRHEVIIPRALAVGRYPLTSAEWNFAPADAYWREMADINDHMWGRRSRMPVIDVSWDHAQAYIRWLSHKTGQPYRLLSEAEWEYACRAGSEAAYSFATDIPIPHPVGEQAANDFGLHDMHGNVMEWCEDCWNDSCRHKPKGLNTNGAAWTGGDCSERVLRGGAFSEVRRIGCRANAARVDIANRNICFGFRMARTLKP